MAMETQRLLDRLHGLAHRHALGPIGCVYLPRDSAPKADVVDPGLHCPAADTWDLAALRHQHTRQTRPGRQRYPGRMRVDGDRPAVADLFPLVVDGEVVGDLAVLGFGRVLDEPTRRQLAIVGAAGRSALLVGCDDDLVAADAALGASERIALHEVLVAASSLSDFVDRLAGWLRARVVVQSPTLELLETSDAQYADLLLSPHHVLAALEPAPGGRGFRTWPIGPVGQQPARMVAQVEGVGPSGVSGYVVVEIEARGCSATHQVLHNLKDLLRQQLTVRREWDQLVELRSQGLVEDLLAGRTGPRVIRQALQLGYDLGSPQRVFALGCGKPGGEPQALVAATLRRWCARPDRSRKPLVGVSDEGYVLVLVPAATAVVGQELFDPELSEFGPVSVGVGPECADLAEVAGAARKAIWAAEFGLTAEPHQAVVEHSDLGLYGLVHDRSWTAELDHFAQDRLGPLVGSTSAGDATLLATLVEVLWAPSLSEAAAALYIHHSTLRYRLRQIERVLQVSLDDPDDRFDLGLALRVLHRGQKPGRRPAESRAR